MRESRGNASLNRANAVVQMALGLSREVIGGARPYRDVRVQVGTVEQATYQPALSFATPPRNRKRRCGQHCSTRNG